MQGDRDSGERRNLPGSAANDNVGPEVRIEDAAMRLARLIGRQIARERFGQPEAGNDNASAGEAGER